ncbi:mitochondrial carrier [Dendrothele bispora CBS 962.96]|uniref:Mitochondrial carrier n=1 Tax=Dendrothele bispora (strain CBS 962.96) TaxID=1314807 RepID=A0A4S8KX16_DENBC|nr:mitochondrial carrier [Dendrothele bispora CBS 962.96]
MSVKREKPIHSLIAGGTAGAIEAFVTYPMEFVKTRSQFGGKKEPPLQIIRSTLSQHGITGLYSGCGALVIGNAAKAGVRFLSYDWFKSKTKLIDDAHQPNPQYRGLVHGTVSIVRQEGFLGIYRSMMRQGANSAIRFTTYSTLKQVVQGAAGARPGQQTPSTITFGIGAVAGLMTVYKTMPLDVVKTRMQPLEARQQYKNSFHCAYRIFTEEGILRFWTGTTPRLARLVMSGGIVFTVYEQIIRIIA